MKKNKGEERMKKGIVIGVIVLALTLPLLYGGCGKKISAQEESERINKLFEASASGSYETVKSLIDSGIDVNAKGDFGWTALMYAAENGYYEVAELLIKHGAEVNARDNDGWTAWMYAMLRGNLKVANLLEQHGARITETDKLIVQNAQNNK